MFTNHKHSQDVLLDRGWVILAETFQYCSTFWMVWCVKPLPVFSSPDNSLVVIPRFSRIIRSASVLVSGYSQCEARRKDLQRSGFDTLLLSFLWYSYTFRIHKRILHVPLHSEMNIGRFLALITKETKNCLLISQVRASKEAAVLTLVSWRHFFRSSRYASAYMYLVRESITYSTTTTVY